MHHGQKGHKNLKQWSDEWQKSADSVNRRHWLTKSVRVTSKIARFFSGNKTYWQKSCAVIGWHICCCLSLGPCRILLAANVVGRATWTSADFWRTTKVTRFYRPSLSFIWLRLTNANYTRSYKTVSTVCSSYLYRVTVEYTELAQDQRRNAVYCVTVVPTIRTDCTF